MKPFAFDSIAEIRRYGYVIGGFADVTDGSSDFENLNRTSLSIEVFPIGENWLPISCDELLIGLARLIGYDSAYDTLVVREAVAKQFAKEFVELFDKDARFYRSFEKEYDASGRFLRGFSTPLTDATFSYAFACVDSVRAGIVVVCDED
ncbi:MAG: hypothetical protein U0930_09310 [Pirellulales bacterium]